MNILHLQLTGNPGGVVTLCRAISAYSQNENHIFFLFSGGTVADAIKSDGGIVYIENANRHRWKRSISNFCKYCKDNKIDIIVNHSNSPIACTHAIAAKKAMPNLKMIMYLHGAAEDMLPKGRRAWIYKWFVKQYEKKTDKVIAISDYVKRSCMASFEIKEEKISIVYNGVDYKKFSAYYNIPQRDTMHLIYVGRLIPEKGVDVLIDAVNLIKKDVKVKVFIVGDGSIKSKLEEQIEKLEMEGQISFLGMQMDIPKLLGEADYFIHPAMWNEGFGITLIEAMSAGVPCVAFNKGAIPEIISNNENGFIVEEATAEALAERLVECYKIQGSDQYIQMKCSAQKTGKIFDISNMVHELEELY